MGSKGTSTQAQQQTSSYSPSPQITAAGTQALAQGQAAAATPFNLPTAPVAGFNPQQQQAFQQYGQLQNIYQPYYNQAQGLFTQAAQGPNVSQFFNPYSQNVISQLQNQQQQQMNQLTGNATQTAGGVGADRIGVAQAELANQQNLATGQTLAGIYGSALTAAQGQQQQEQSAAYGLGQLGGANLQSALGATNALYGSGAYQQQLNQAQLNAQYQNQLQQQAYPFQTAQYLGNLTSGLSGSLASTTNAYGTGQATPAQPSPYSQALGLGGLGLGVYGLSGGFGGGGGYMGPSSIGGAPLSGYSGVTPQYDTGGGVGGGVGDDSGQDNPYGNSSPYGGGGVNYDPNSSDNTGADIGGKYKDWLSTNTDVPSGQIQKGTIHQDPTLNMNMNQNSSSGKGSSSSLGDISSLLNIAKSGAALAALARGGRAGFATDGAVDDDDTSPASFDQRLQPAEFNPLGDLSRDDAIRFLANQNNPGSSMPRSISTSAPPDLVSSDFTSLDPQSVKDVTTFGGQTPVGQMPPRTNIPLPMGRPAGAPSDYQPAASGTGMNGDAPYRIDNGPSPDQAPTRGLTVNPQNQVTSPRATQPTTPDDPTAADVATAKGRENAAGMQGKNTPYPVPYPDANSGDSATSRSIMRNPWMALIAASAGTLAGGSPFAAQNIGAGLGTGLKYMESERKSGQEEESINQRAQQLAQQAEFHKDEYTKIKPYEAGELAIRQQAADQAKEQLVQGFDPVKGTPFAYWTSPGQPPTPVVGQVPGGAGAPAQAPGGSPPPAGPGGAGNAAPLLNGPQPPQGGPQVAANGPPPIPPQQPAPVPPAQAGAAPPAQAQMDRTNLAYVPPTNDPAHGPGPVFNPKTGVPTAESASATRQDFKEATARSRSAAESLSQVGQLEQSLHQIDELNKNGVWGTGTGAAARMNLARTLNTIGAPLGLQPVDPAILANAEEAQKITTRLGFALSRSLGSREAQQIVQQSIGANPGLENTPEGRRYIIATIRAAANMDRDAAQFTADYHKQWHSTMGAEQEFHRLNPPERYTAQAAVASAPPQFQDPKEFKAAVDYLRSHSDNPKAVATFNKIYHGSASYFLKNE